MREVTAYAYHNPDNHSQEYVPPAMPIVTNVRSTMPYLEGPMVKYACGNSTSWKPHLNVSA